MRTISIGLSGMLNMLQSTMNQILEYKSASQVKNELMASVQEAIAIALWKGRESAQAFQIVQNLLKHVPVRCELFYLAAKIYLEYALVHPCFFKHQNKEYLFLAKKCLHACTSIDANFWRAYVKLAWIEMMQDNLSQATMLLTSALYKMQSDTLVVYKYKEQTIRNMLVFVQYLENPQYKYSMSLYVMLWTKNLFL